MKTIEQMFRNIKEEIFLNDEVERIPQMTPEERNGFLLKHVDRLLSVENTPLPDGRHTEIVAAWFSDMFWTADEGRIPMHSDNPMLDNKEVSKLNDNDLTICQFYVDAAGLCHDLYNHQEFELSMFGLSEEEWYESFFPKLTACIRQLPYPNIARHAAYTVRQKAIEQIESMHYMAAYDHLGLSLNRRLDGASSYPYECEMPSSQYVDALLEDVADLARIFSEGEGRGLPENVIIIHNTLLNSFSKGLQPELVDKASHLALVLEQLYDDKDWKLRNSSLQQSMQPPVIQQQITDVIDAFYDEILITAGDLISEDSLQMSYLLDYAEWFCHGEYYF